MIRKAKPSDLKDISHILSKDLSADRRFPKEMLEKLKEHARVENLQLELDKPEIMCFVSVDGGIIGFIVGYQKGNECYLDYVWGTDMDTRKKLLRAFESECKARAIRMVKAEAYGHMENNRLYSETGFKRMSEKQLKPGLTIIFYEKPVA